VALQYGAGDNAPVVVASGMGYMAEKIVEVAAEHGVPIYEDNSLATVLTQLQLGKEIPEELYQAIVEIYVYFLHFDPNAREQAPPPAQEPVPDPPEKPAEAEQGDMEEERE
jgi:flagellar biosynthesis protein